MNKRTHHFDDLVWKYLDESIGDEEFADLQQLLRDQEPLRRRYQLLVEVHHGLRLGPGDADVVHSPVQRSSSRVFRKSALFWLGTAAAVLVAVFSALSLSGTSLDVTLVSQRGASWRGVQPQPGEKLSTRMMHLNRGAIALRFPAGTSAIIEGPAWFQLLDNETIELSMGTMSVHHQGDPGRFKVLTPVGQFTDLGTKFGVCVGDGALDSVVMTEVYEGQVCFEGTGTSESSLHLEQGDAYAIVGDHGRQELSREFRGMDVKVSATFDLTDDGSSLQSVRNLALGKPVYSPAYYNTPRDGDVFPPTTLTDGRLADTGSPGDWSFWLAPDGENGSFTLDLEAAQTVSRIELQNTRNRHWDDRGVENFRIDVSVDGQSFTPLLEGRLERVASRRRQAFRFEAFEFAPTSARFIRLTVLSHYRNDHRSFGKQHHSGGLNEIRVFE